MTSHINVDLSYKSIRIEHKITDSTGQIHIHNDMGVKENMFANEGDKSAAFTCKYFGYGC